MTGKVCSPEDKSGHPGDLARGRRRRDHRAGGGGQGRHRPQRPPCYDRPAAGKTGTNNENKEAWFVGFTPQLSTAVGMYREECRTKGGKVVKPDQLHLPRRASRHPKKYNANKPYTKALRRRWASRVRTRPRRSGARS